MNKVQYFVTENAITVLLLSDMTVFSWPADNPKFDAAKAFACMDDETNLRLLINETKAIMSGNINIKEGTVAGVKSENKLMKLIQMCRDKGICEESIEHIRPFLENCLKNPYINAVEEILDFVTKLELFITSDGCFLAYKNVRSDLKSIHDGKTMHAVGTYVEEPNFDCDRTRTCSAGLHFCSKDYLKAYPGEVTICVKVNPIDVVAIPTDYNFEKGRCCKYYVVGIMPTGRFFSDEDFDVAEYFDIECVDAASEMAAAEEEDNDTIESFNAFLDTVTSVAKAAMGIITDKEDEKEEEKPKGVTDRMWAIYQLATKRDTVNAAIHFSISEETVKRTVRKVKAAMRG